MVGFFEQFPVFLSTSKTTPQLSRLEGRHQAIISPHMEAFRGKKVLDIGSHDGRWSFAELKAGADHVTGIEPREELVANAVDTFRTYGVDESRFTFVIGDIFEYLTDQKFDIVLCLGYYYHTIRHVELFHKMASTLAELIIIDTEVVPRSEEKPVQSDHGIRMVRENPFVIHLLPDPSANESMAYADPTTRSGNTLVGRPSRAAIGMIGEHFGYKCSSFDWAQYLTGVGHDDVADYASGWRETFSFHRT